MSDVIVFETRQMPNIQSFNNDIFRIEIEKNKVLDRINGIEKQEAIRLIRELVDEFDIDPTELVESDVSWR